MKSVVQKKKKSLFGKIAQKIESEFTSREDKHVSSDVTLDDSCRNSEETVIIKSRRDELKSAKYDNSEEIIIVV